jgi:hypothetical protein
MLVPSASSSFYLQQAPHVPQRCRVTSAARRSPSSRCTERLARSHPPVNSPTWLCFLIAISAGAQVHFSLRCYGCFRGRAADALSLLLMQRSTTAPLNSLLLAALLLLLHRLSDLLSHLWPCQRSPLRSQLHLSLGTGSFHLDRLCLLSRQAAGSQEIGRKIKPVLLLAAPPVAAAQTACHAPTHL